MIGSRNEHTIASVCEVSGRGYWSGQPVQVVFTPARAGTGILLMRSDLPGTPVCPANVEFADSIQFRTNLSCGQARFQMVEHLMAALAGLEIDNCLVEINAEELPGLDGSSLPYVEALQYAGLVIQPASRQRLVIDEIIEVTQDGGSLRAIPVNNPQTTFTYTLDYGPNSPVREATYRVNVTPREFTRQIAPARTFVTESQAKQLRASGVASHVTNQELLVIGDQGPVENNYRFRNECARHKTLDLIGDLALVGVDLVGQFVSKRGGHRLNGLMAKKLAQMIAAQNRASRKGSQTWNDSGPNREAA